MYLAGWHLSCLGPQIFQQLQVRYFKSSFHSQTAQQHRSNQAPPASAAAAGCQHLDALVSLPELEQLRKVLFTYRFPEGPPSSGAFATLNDLRLGLDTYPVPAPTNMWTKSTFAMVCDALGRDFIAVSWPLPSARDQFQLAERLISDSELTAKPMPDLAFSLGRVDVIASVLLMGLSKASIARVPDGQQPLPASGNVARHSKVVPEVLMQAIMGTLSGVPTHQLYGSSCNIPAPALRKSGPSLTCNMPAAFLTPDKALELTNSIPTADNSQGAAASAGTPQVHSCGCCNNRFTPHAGTLEIPLCFVPAAKQRLAALKAAAAPAPAATPQQSQWKEEQPPYIKPAKAYMELRKGFLDTHKTAVPSDSRSPTRHLPSLQPKPSAAKGRALHSTSAMTVGADPGAQPKIRRNCKPAKPDWNSEVTANTTPNHTGLQALASMDGQGKQVCDEIFADLAEQQQGMHDQPGSSSSPDIGHPSASSQRENGSRNGSPQQPESQTKVASCSRNIQPPPDQPPSAALRNWCSGSSSMGPAVTEAKHPGTAQSRLNQVYDKSCGDIPKKQANQTQACKASQSPIAGSSISAMHQPATSQCRAEGKQLIGQLQSEELNLPSPTGLSSSITSPKLQLIPDDGDLVQVDPTTQPNWDEIRSAEKTAAASEEAVKREAALKKKAYKAKARQLTASRSKSKAATTEHAPKVADQHIADNQSAVQHLQPSARGAWAAAPSALHASGHDQGPQAGLAASERSAARQQQQDIQPCPKPAQAFLPGSMRTDKATLKGQRAASSSAQALKHDQHLQSASTGKNRQAALDEGQQIADGLANPDITCASAAEVQAAEASALLKFSNRIGSDTILNSGSRQAGSSRAQHSIATGPQQIEHNMCEIQQSNNAVAEDQQAHFPALQGGEQAKSLPPAMTQQAQQGAVHGAQTDAQDVASNLSKPRQWKGPAGKAQRPASAGLEQHVREPCPESGDKPQSSLPGQAPKLQAVKNVALEDHAQNAGTSNAASAYERLLAKGEESGNADRTPKSGHAIAYGRRREAAALQQGHIRKSSADHRMASAMAMQQQCITSSWPQMTTVANHRGRQARTPYVPEGPLASGTDRSTTAVTRQRAHDMSSSPQVANAAAHRNQQPSVRMTRTQQPRKVNKQARVTAGKRTHSCNSQRAAAAAVSGCDRRGHDEGAAQDVVIEGHGHPGEKHVILYKMCAWVLRRSTVQSRASKPLILFTVQDLTVFHVSQMAVSDIKLSTNQFTAHFNMRSSNIWSRWSHCLH